MFADFLHILQKNVFIDLETFFRIVITSVSRKNTPKVT